MAGSILVAVRKELTTRLGQLKPLSGVEVGYAWKGSSKKREKIFTRRGRFTHDVAGMRAGRNFRNETGRFELVILVQGVGRDVGWTSDRAMELGVACEEFIADHKSDELGVLGLQTLIVDGEGEVNEISADRSTWAEIAYPITYTARLT